MSNLLYSSSDDSDSEGRRRAKVYRQRVNYDFLSDFEFKERFRLNREELEYVLERIGSKLVHKTTKNKALSPTQQLLTALHWFGNGGQYHGVSDMHGISKATVCRALHKVVEVIVSDLFQDVVRWPINTNDLAIEFMQLGGFPSVGGCLDGTIVKLDAPFENEGQFVDRNGNHSLNCLMVCGPDQMFYYASSRWPGSVHDSRVIRNSSLTERWESGWRPFSDAVLLGDSGYALKEWLMTPLHSDPDDPAEQKYNKSHKSTRRIIESSFGILKKRFPCLKYGLRVQPEFAGMIVLACVTLHNIAKKDDFEYAGQPDLNPPPEEEDPVPDEGPTEAGLHRQNELLSYFA